MWLAKLAKDGDSQITGCQTVYLDEGGWLTVQGDQIDAETYANLEHVLPGEGAVRIKPEVVVEAVRQYQERTA